ncbi:TetR/AcrR family transcriptional regulator [Rivularia sp. UHCC 0363]|uniref:TetR/AcrR family transcriptional regulator n=1 Tax=Rivularia sp. UHCC 0363 TaxID=3110244 RepID=UPI002B1F7F2C|nr:TetR/AcrR family transcriptional regulator [Rivularia sp. UHCC 0363]MEA5596927.1 TetR/AcrR family transcriptional regulator [Rivularia sp. UHCC 0363]
MGKFKAKKSALKSEKILFGAMPEFLKRGYSDTSMDRIAASSGVSKQTLYSHFKDKETLFSSLVKHMATQRFQTIFGIKYMQGEPEQVLRNLANTLLSEIMSEPPEYQAFMRLIISESGRFPHLPQVFIRNLALPAHQALSNYFAVHTELNISDTEAVARIFIGTLINFMITQEILNGKEIMPMSAERLIDTLVYLILCSRNN